MRTHLGTRWWTPTILRSVAVTALFLFLGLSGCATERNLLQNNGFEEGPASWRIIDAPEWLPMEIAGDRALSGNQSLRTHLVSLDNGRGSVIAGAFQEVPVAEGQGVPKRLSGHYFLERWDSDAPRTYLQVVVMLYSNAGSQSVTCQQLPNEYPCQVAFVLGGVSQVPIAVANRRFVFIETGIPESGSWTQFDLSIADTFREQWGTRNPDLASVRVYLEIRYEKPPEDSPYDVDVDVYWDDIILS